MPKTHANRASLISLCALLGLAGRAGADCLQTGNGVDCSTEAPNPYVGQPDGSGGHNGVGGLGNANALIGTGPGSTTTTVTVNAGAELVSDRVSAISLGDDAVITVNGSVVGTDLRPDNGNYDEAGSNLIEFNDHGSLTVASGSLVSARGDVRDEPVNLIGGGNTIINRGTIYSQTATAFWFQNRNDSENLNTIDNYGLLQQGGSLGGTGGFGSIMGASEDGPVLNPTRFINECGGRVNGDIGLAANSDNAVILYGGSTISGAVDAGTGSLSLRAGRGTGCFTGTADRISNLREIFVDSGLWNLGSVSGTNLNTSIQSGAGLVLANGALTSNIDILTEASLSAVPVRSVDVPVHGNEYVTTITGNLTNAGTIVAGPAGRPTSWVIDGNYTGLSGLVRMNVTLNSRQDSADARFGDGNDRPGDSPGDVLIITPGHSITGLTRLAITNTGGLGKKTRGNGIEVVEAVGTSGSGRFVLASTRLVAGLYEYGLYQGNAAGVSDPDSSQDWYLRSRVRSEIPLYKAIPSVVTGYTHTLLDTLHERVGEEFAGDQPEVFAGPSAAAEAGMSGIKHYAHGAWSRIIGSTGTFGPGDLANPTYSQTSQALQLGVDLYRGRGERYARDFAGIYAAIGQAFGHVRDPATQLSAGDFGLTSYSLGGYWSHFGETGWYLDGLAQIAFHDLQASASTGVASRTNAWGLAASLEGGYPFIFGPGLIAEPQAQLVYQTAFYGRMSDPYSHQSFEDDSALAGRVGLRLAKNWRLESRHAPRNLSLWIRPSLWHEFLSTPNLNVASPGSSALIVGDGRNSWLDARIGVDTPIMDQGAFYVSAGYQLGIDDRRDSYDIKLGVRLSF